MKYLQNNLDFLINENVQAAKNYLTKKEIPLDNKFYLEIRKLLKGHDGYVYWFVYQHFENGVSLDDLKQIFDIILNERGVVSRFKTKVVDLENIEKFWDEYNSVKYSLSIKSVLDRFPKLQRSFINDSDNELIKSLSEDKEVDNFIAKISRYKSRSELINAIKNFISNKTSTKLTTLIDSLESADASVVYSSQDHNIVIDKVDYSQTKKFGGDTSWCIVNSKSTFESYVNHGILGAQFIIFLTDQTGNMSKIGVTTNLKGYYTAHLKNDAHFPKSKLDALLKERGTKFGVMMPSKESVSIKMFDGIPVESLLQVGFTKEEILEHKNIFKKGHNDLSNFTKE